MCSVQQRNFFYASVIKCTCILKLFKCLQLSLNTNYRVLLCIYQCKPVRGGPWAYIVHVHCYCQIVMVFRISFLAFRSFLALSFYVFFVVSPKICLPTYDVRNKESYYALYYLDVLLTCSGKLLVRVSLSTC